MYDQIREDKLYIMLYAVATAMSMLASCYLLFRRVMPSPLTLRRQYAFAAGLLPSLPSPL